MNEPIQNSFQAAVSSVLPKSFRSRLARLAWLSLCLGLLCLLGVVTAGRAEAQRYYIVDSNGYTIDADAGIVTNLPNGSNSDYFFRTTRFSTSNPNDSTTTIRNDFSDDGSYHILGMVYVDAYSSDTAIGSTASASMVLRSSSDRDEFQFLLVDYDPATNTHTPFAYAYVGSPGNSKTRLTFNFTDSTYTMNAGHRLMVAILFRSVGGTHTGRVYCNNRPDNTSYIDVAEGVPTPTPHTITANVGSGSGTISPSGSVTVNDGANQTFDFTPSATYYVSDVVVDSVSLGALPSYTFNNVVTDHTIGVSFVQKFLITPSPGAHGNISPSMPVLVASGGSQTFSISPDSGYEIQDVQVNGVSVGAVNSYTITPTADTTISATFSSVTSKIANYTVTPPFLPTQVPPNVMIMLSVETPMQGDAYPDLTCSGNPASTTYGCTNNASNVGGLYVSNNYSNTTVYSGYFDPGKCYVYSGSGSSGMFVPDSNATNHQCGGTKWSGNFLNFATTMALDSFRIAFTGGNRAVDVGGTTPSTVLLGGRQTLGKGHSWFPIKRIDNASNYIPFTGTRYIVRHANGFSVCSSTSCGVAETGTGETRFPVGGGSYVSGAYNLLVKVCDPAKGLDPSCNSTTLKPEGILQKYQDQMRFGLISYAMRSNQDATRDGGVIRANVKWIQPTIPYNAKYHDSTGALTTCTTTSGCANPEAELNEDGTFSGNPDSASGGKSGLINYLNKFGYNSGYKSLDPVSEMYYEVVRYFRNLGPSTDNYCNSIGTVDDTFPAYCSSNAWNKTSNPYGWRDPFIYPCSQSAVVGVQDANPWLDKRIPGTAFTKAYGGSYNDYGVPSNADTSINVRQWTNKVGNDEGLTPGWLYVGCVFDGTNACSSIDSGTVKYVEELGRVVGTAPWAGKENSYYIAGLAYFAHTTDLRSDIAGKNTLTSYLIDTQEPNANMLVGKYNMLYLAAKYGGFNDTDGDGKPFTNSTCGTSTPDAKCAEWDSTGTGFPDTYMFASDPGQVATGLNRAFTDILRRLSSGTAASILNNSEGSGANLLQAVFYPLKTFEGNTQATWIGELQNLWYYIDPFFTSSSVREDTVADKKLNLIDDYVTNFYFDSAQNQTNVNRMKDTYGNGNYTSIDTISPDDVRSLWRAGQALLSTSPGSRTIKTVVPVSGSDTMIDFTTANASANTTLQSYLQASGATEAVSIVDYIRGTDYPRSGYSSDPVYRGRTITFKGTTGVWKLGDIIASTPRIQGNVRLNTYGLSSPSGYGDTTYTGFIDSYEYQTRGTAYVGGNDGMLHAFKFGLLDVRLSSQSNTSKARLVKTGTANLATEQWAFIPKHALPYLRYLADPSYGHLYYVDGAPLLVDASIKKVNKDALSNAAPICSDYWNCPRQTVYLKDVGGNTVMGDTGIPIDPTKSPNDASLSHPADFIQKAKIDPANTSWRTILIGAMGLGGASRNSSDSCSAGTATASCVKTPITGVGYSSYFALDVTDPSNPQYLWNFAGDTGHSDPADDNYLGFSTSGPAIVRVGNKATNGRWFAVFASGPTGPIDIGSKQFIGTSNQNLKLFIVDLASGALVKTIDTGIANAFSGSISNGVIDTDRWDSSATDNYQDDTVYIGYTMKDTSTNTWTKGGVIRLLTKEDTDPNNWVVIPLITGIGPVTTSVSKLQDRANKTLWVYFGTGRYFYKSSANPDDSASQRSLFGIKDPCYSTSTGPVNDFDNSCTEAAITNLSVLTDQTGASSAPASTLDASSKGWYIDLDCIGTSCSSTPLNDGYMSERVITDPLAAVNGTVFFTTFRPTSDVCGFGGNSYIWAVAYNSGATPRVDAMRGKILIQVSTGSFAEIDLKDAFTAKYKRRVGTPIKGVPPKAQGISLLTPPKPAKKILQIQEK